MPSSRRLLLAATLIVALASVLRAQQPAFVENRGQWDARARFLARLPGLDAWIGDREIVYDLYRESIVVDTAAVEGSLVPPPVRRAGQAVRMRFVDAAGTATADIRNRSDGHHNYIFGNDRSRWVHGARLYHEVSLDELYPGIDARVLIDDGSLRYDLIVAPGADASRIAVAFDGARGVRIDERGELVIATSVGEISHRGLFAYQMHGSVRSAVDCDFELRDDGSVGFRLGEYDRERPLVIDPIVWSRYLGHSGESSAATLAADSAGNVFITGTVFSAGYPVSVDAYDKVWANGSDVVVTRLNVGGSVLSYSTYIGGDGNEWAGRIAIDRGGYAYVAMMTASSNFPTTAGAFDESYNGGTLDGAVVKLSQGAQSVMYSTIIGGSDGEDGLDILVDTNGAACVSGWTTSRDFPTTSGVLHPGFLGGTADAFISRIAPDGASLEFSTYLGGASADHATSIAIDSIGAIYVAGYTESADFPTTPGAIKRTISGQQDAFVSKINPAATVLMFSTYFGGSAHEGNAFIEVDGIGEAYIAGQTSSSDFPVTQGCFQTSAASQYAVRFNSLGTAVQYSTFLGSTSDRVGAAALARGGFLCITGSTSSRAYPTTADAISRSYLGGSTDAYVTIVRPSGATLAYSTYLGGGAGEQGLGIGLDRRGDLYVSGGTTSTNFPSTMPQSRPEGLTDFFVTKIGRCLVVARAGADRTLCLGDSLTIGAVATSGIPPFTYRWWANGAPIDADTAVLAITPTQTTVYVVTASDWVGCDNSDTVIVTVNPAPMVEAGADTAICHGSSVRIGAQAVAGTPPFSYAWQPATGLSSRTAPSPTARPDSTTTYVVTVNDAKGCQARDTITVTVNRPPVLEALAEYEICAGDTATLGVSIAAGAPPFTYAWSPSAGLSDASAATPRAAPAATTTYRVTVTDANGCSTTSTGMIVRVGSTLRTRIAASGSTTLCPGTTITLDAGEFAEYLWSTGSTERTITVAEPGSYYVAVTSASGCTGGSDTVRVEAGEPAVAEFTGATNVCPEALAEYTAPAPAGSLLTWRIAGGRGIIESGAGSSRLQVRWRAPGIDTLHLTVTSADGCVDSSFLAVTIVAALEPTLLISGSTSLCPGDSLVLDAGGGFAGYTWSNGATGRTLIVREAGEYWVDVVDASGCTGRSDSVRVVVRTAPAPEITAHGTEICAGDSAVLIASPGFASYVWSNGMSGRSIAVSSAGNYDVEVTDSNGCLGRSESLEIVVHPLPSAPTITQSGDTLVASDAAAWQWFRDGAPIEGAITRRFVRQMAGEYSVEIMDSNGCRARAIASTVERRLARLDSVSATVGERLHLSLIVAPALRASDGVTGYSVRLRLDPADLFAHAVRPPASNPGIALPTMNARADGTVELDYDGPAAVAGDTLARIELQGLSTARPVSVVTIESIELRGGDARIAGNGLVLLDGCDVGTFSVGKRVRIVGTRIDDATRSLVVTYRAPRGAQPSLAMLDGAGGRIAYTALETGTEMEQQVRLALPGSGFYIIELRDRAERSAAAIVVTR